MEYMSDIVARKYPLNGLRICAAGLFCVFGSLTTASHAVADQADNIYGAADPFDPSEVVSHTPKGDISLRVKLPAPDLPPSIVVSAHDKFNTATPKTAPRETAASESPAPHEPGIITKSVRSVLSLFDWSGSDEEDNRSRDAETAALIKKHEPIRINVHVGIKPKKEVAESTETSNLESPLSRAQSRVRRLFTFSEPKTHD